MEQIRWFDRKFYFDFEQNIFPSILERMSGTELRIKDKIFDLPTEYLELKPEGKWSVKEHIGHLTDLEPLWQGRLQDILNGEEYLRPADLENKKTDLADHNQKDPLELLADFSSERKSILLALGSLQEADLYKSALHPRLKKPMRIMDLFLFVAEHDDHHLVKMNEVLRA